MIIFTLLVKKSKYLSHFLPQDEKIKLIKCVYPRDFARLFTGLFDLKKLSRIKPSGQVVDETKITS